jgi:hypothetical protein
MGVTYAFGCAATHRDDTFPLIVLGPAEAADPLGADLVEEDLVDVDREAIGGGVNHTIHRLALLQVDCQRLQVQIFRLLCTLSVDKRALLVSDLLREVGVLPVNLEEALGAGGLLRGDDPAVLDVGDEPEPRLESEFLGCRFHRRVALRSMHGRQSCIMRGPLPPRQRTDAHARVCGEPIKP